MAQYMSCPIRYAFEPGRGETMLTTHFLEPISEPVPLRKLASKSGQSHNTSLRHFSLGYPARQDKCSSEKGKWPGGLGKQDIAIQD